MSVRRRWRIGAFGSFAGGVLEITIPKPEQKKPQHVQITLGDRPNDDTKTTTNQKHHGAHPLSYSEGRPGAYSDGRA